ncbi:MAG: helix-turn-helix domain-containing protein [Proteobacteria bacterium]|jgi:cytoskeletal protein RodZ|nr:helix-turn-helix domain-containing protein [Pseudomonadota bacterium]
MNHESKSTHHENSTTVVHIGDYLKREREAIKVSIEKVSQKTKINLNILKSLEANDFKSLPSPAYVKGFVLSYARVLGLSPEDVINKLEYSYLTIVGKPFPALNHSKNTEPLQINPELNDPAKVLEDEKKIESRKKLVLPVTLGISVVVGVVGLYNLLTGTIKKEIKSTQTDEVPTAPITVEAQPVSETTAPVVTDAVPDKPVTTEAIKDEAPKEVVKVPKTAPPQPVLEAAKPEEKPAINLAKRIFPPKDFRKINLKLFAYQDGDEATMSLLNEETKSKFDGNQENVYINAADGDTWLSYKVDDKKIQSVSLKKGEGIFLQGKKVLMFFGNVKATRIFYQNKLIDAPTPTGFKSLIFPESETKKHMLPLFPKASNDMLYTAEEYIQRMTEEEKQVSN